MPLPFCTPSFVTSSTYQHSAPNMMLLPCMHVAVILALFLYLLLEEKNGTCMLKTSSACVT